MKNLITFSLLLLIVIPSCKKKEDNSSDSRSYVTFSQIPVSSFDTVTPATVTISNASTFNGFLTDFNTYSIQNGQIEKMKTAFAAFYHTPQKPAIQTGSNIRVKKVALNGDSMVWRSAGSYSHAIIQDIENGKWEVVGAQGISSFSFNPPFGEPTASDLKMIPDLIDKSLGLSLTIKVSNAKSGNFILTKNWSANTLVATLVNGDNVINFTPNDLKYFEDAQCIIQLTNDGAYVLGGKDFRFTKELYFSKWVGFEN